MKPTLIDRKASNWVDRGAPAEPTLARILAHCFDLHDPARGPWLAEHATYILGLVAADASEVQVTGYLRGMARELGRPTSEPLAGRMIAVALWHAAKAALVRDFAERVLRGEVPVNAATPEPLGDWLAARLLTPEELATHEAERASAAAPGTAGLVPHRGPA